MLPFCLPAYWLTVDGESALVGFRTMGNYAASRAYSYTVAAPLVDGEWQTATLAGQFNDFFDARPGPLAAPPEDPSVEATLSVRVVNRKFQGRAPDGTEFEVDCLDRAAPAARATPSSTAAATTSALDVKALEARLQALRGPGRGADAASLLGSLGVAAADLAGLTGKEVTEASIVRSQLDSDPELEAVVRLSLRGDDYGSNTTHDGAWHYLVLADVFGSELRPTGDRTLVGMPMMSDATLKLALQPVHASGINDVVVRFTYTYCDMCEVRTHFEEVLVLTMERAKVDTLFARKRDYQDNQPAGQFGTGDKIELVGPAPSVIRVSRDGRVRETLRFDASAFHYAGGPSAAR